MNAKRQTIWLVSMLSLMVVLSAYYLFTEDVDKMDLASNAPKTEEVKIDLSQVTPDQAAAMQTGKTTAADAKTGDKASDAAKTDPAKSADAKAADPKAADPKAADPKSGEKTPADKSAAKDGKEEAAPVSADAKVLQQMQASSKSGRDYLTKLQLERNDQLAAQTEKLLTTITDNKQSAEAVSKAQQQLQQIEDTVTRVTNVEDVLSKDYPNAVLTQEGSKWKVTVQAEKLEKSQAVSIVETVMKELNVGPEVAVQYIK
ncbi:SpoIIIAH-like family protein [Paenibacillus sp. FJAT-26967]|uniref:SpoIIIAH-like family protein n=1 Tax=Paenibacillus sp. FJAT-26967 TaxID=1729690 RepID=UPI000839620B|nr:SpoIIIAH-like family protein [Paenibacillus sp. FJAT-26967]